MFVRVEVLIVSTSPSALCSRLIWVKVRVRVLSKILTLYPLGQIHWLSCLRVDLWFWSGLWFLLNKLAEVHLNVQVHPIRRKVGVLASATLDSTQWFIPKRDETLFQMQMKNVRLAWTHSTPLNFFS